ncbi:right-handed parallel beta-helix repeat-containing protein [Oryzobacter telluris]|uniref:right-handed parallel beta-helix repeat-containing protein n=1 Tax=Oryzobacter telluris TaxID=3149179 RepID=UPI00370D3FE2
MRSRRGQGTGRARGFVVLATAAFLLVAGCTGTGSGGVPTPTPPSQTPDRCAEAVSAIVEATQDYVVGFGPVDQDQVPPPASPSPGASATSSPTPSASATSAENVAFQDALTTARTQLAQYGCEVARTRQALESGLRAVTTQGPVAGAVLRQLTATMTGTGETLPTTRRVGTDDDLLTAVAELPAGSTIELAAGTHRLDDVLVLLSPITIRGAGTDTTVLESSVPDFAVLAIADGAVSVADLSLRHTGKQPASVVLVGPTASLVVTDSALSGGVANRDGTGGAGILMYDPDARARRTTTSLEVTGTRFSGNGSAGVVLTGGHVASIAGSTFVKNAQCGVCFLDASGGSVQDSTFTDNTVGVAATATAAPTVVGSTIRGGEVGIQAGDRSTPVIDRVKVSGASRAALIWAGRAEGAIRGVTCSDVTFGLVVGPDVAPTVRDSTCAIAPSG